MNQLDMLNESSCTNRIVIAFSMAFPLIIHSEISSCLHCNKHLFCIVEKKTWSIFRQPIQSLYREKKKNIAIMWGSNCYTHCVVLWKACFLKRVLILEPAMVLVRLLVIFCCYVPYYLLINQMFYMEFEVFLTVHHSINLFLFTNLMHNSFIL
jgi:hypothetical protein